MQPNIVGYHTNKVEESDRFVKHGLLILSHDTEYLGRGMYFWDNTANAKYWARKKLREVNVSTVHISSATIILSPPILDMTDQDVIGKISLLWNAYCKKMGEHRTNQFIGTILDILGEYFDEIDCMKVAKCHGDYSGHTKHKFLDQQKGRIDDLRKTIYSVRCDSRVLNSKHVEIINRK